MSKKAPPPPKEADDEKGDGVLAATPGSAQAPEKKGFGIKQIVLFIVLPILVLGGIGAGLYFSGFLDQFLKKPDAEHAAAPAEGDHGGGHGGGKGGEHGAPVGPAFLKIPDIIVNLNTPDGQPRYLRLSVQLELKNDTDLKAVEMVMPRVVDQFQTYLRELRVKDLQGSSGVYRLQMELLSRVNTAAQPVEVQDVLFQEILIQ